MKLQFYKVQLFKEPRKLKNHSPSTPQHPRNKPYCQLNKHSKPWEKPQKESSYQS